MMFNLRCRLLWLRFEYRALWEHSSNTRAVVEECFQVTPRDPHSAVLDQQFSLHWQSFALSWGSGHSLPCGRSSWSALWHPWRRLKWVQSCAQHHCMRLTARLMLLAPCTPVSLGVIVGPVGPEKSGTDEPTTVQQCSMAPALDGQQSSCAALVRGHIEAELWGSLRLRLRKLAALQ